MIQLLISIKKAEEAPPAARGGADIIDVKNPEEGSLGAGAPWVISQARRLLPKNVPLSASIGDFPDLPGSAALAAFGAAKAGASIVKVGLKGVRKTDKAVHFLRQVVRAAREANENTKIVACAYGDFRRAKTINPLLLPKIASSAGASIVMLDTAVKDGKSLVEFLSSRELAKFIEKARSLGLTTALAGGLVKDDLEILKRLLPDIVGFRGAVCEGKNRVEGEISELLVRELKELLGREHADSHR